MQMNRSSHSEQLFFWFAFILSHMDLCTCIMGLNLALLQIFVGYCFKYHTCNELKLITYLLSATAVGGQWRMNWQELKGQWTSWIKLAVFSFLSINPKTKDVTATFPKTSTYLILMSYIIEYL